MVKLSDVSAQNAAESKTDQMREKMALRILRQFPSLLWTVDREMVFTSFHTCNSPIQGDLVVGKNLAIFVAPEHGGLGLYVKEHEKALLGQSTRYRTCWENVYYDVLLEPLRDDDAAIVGVIGVAIDVTDIVKNEVFLQQSRTELLSRVEQRTAELELSEARFRGAFNSAYSGMVLVGVDFRILQANPSFCEMLGYELDELIGKHIREITHPDDYAASDAMRAALVAGALPRGQFEKRMLRKDGSELWALVSIVIMRDAHGQPLHFITHVHDIQARRQTEELRSRFIESVIAAQEDERRRIAVELHDETGQWLTALAIGLRTLEDQTDNETTREHVQILRQLTKSTLDNIGRISRGLHPRILDDLGFITALNRYVADFRRAHELHVTLQIDGCTAQTRFDPHVEVILYRAIQEALTNIAKHAHASIAAINVRCSAQNLTVTIADNGRGFVVDPQTGGATDSLGLGLWGMRERVQWLKGSLNIESVPDGGTTIFVRVPVKSPHAVDVPTENALNLP